MKYSDLIAAPTEAELDARLRTTAANKGATPASWLERSLPAVMVAIFAYVLYTLYQLVKDFAQGANFNTNADESFAELHAESQFDSARIAARFANYTIRLTCAAGLGPYDINPGDFIVGTTWGLDYSNRDVATVPSGSFVDVTFIADEAAAAYNVSLVQISQIHTPLAGVTISAIAQTAEGTDIELISDLIERCQGMWGGLGAASAEFVANLAKALDPTLTKIRTRVDTTTAGKMTIYAGTDSTPAGSELVTAFQAVIDALQVFQAVDVTVVAATVENIAVLGTVTCKVSRVAEAQAAVSAALIAWQKDLGFGDSIPLSDFWRKLFGSDAIAKVALLMADSYDVNSWSMTVLINSLTFEEG